MLPLKISSESNEEYAENWGIEDYYDSDSDTLDLSDYNRVLILN